MNSAPNSMAESLAESCCVKIRPPIRLRASSTNTEKPTSPNLEAAANPAIPPPIINTDPSFRACAAVTIMGKEKGRFCIELQKAALVHFHFIEILGDTLSSACALFRGGTSRSSCCTNVYFFSQGGQFLVGILLFIEC